MSDENSSSIYQYCSVPGCKKNPKHTCFTLPRDPEKSKAWCSQLGIEEHSQRKIFICEIHFEDGLIKKSNNLTTDLARITLPAFNTPAAQTCTNNQSTMPPLSAAYGILISTNTPPVPSILNLPEQETNDIFQSNIPQWTAPKMNLPINVITTNFQSNIPPYASQTLNLPVDDTNQTPIPPNDIPIPNLPVKETHTIVQSTITQGALSGLYVAANDTSQISTPIITNEIINVSEDEIDANNTSNILSQNHEYENLVTDIIINSLNHSPSQIKIPAHIKPLDIPINSTSTSAKRRHRETSQEKNDNKRLKTCRAQNRTKPSDPDYIPKTIEELVKQIVVISQRPKVLVSLAVQIYLRYTQVYKLLYTALNLPPVSTLKSMFDDRTISTNNNTLFAQTLQYKLIPMSDVDKHCIVCLEETLVKKNIYYDIQNDKLLGIYDINNVQKPEIANRALLLSVRGLFADWKQPIAVAYVSGIRNVYMSIKQWIHENILNLLKIGYNVRAFVSETDYLSIMPIKNRKIIYNIYDVPSLFKLLYYNFLTHDFFFNGGFVSRRHILDFYAIDSMKPLKLCPKLTNKHMKPEEIQDINLKLVTEVISNNTAAAMSAYIDFKVLDQSATHTVQFISDMSTLFDILYSNNVNESIKLASGETQIQFLRKMLSYLSDFKLVNPKTKRQIPKNGTFAEKIEISIKSILMLYEDITANKESEFIPTRRLTLDDLGHFFDKIKELHKDSKRPSCKEINSEFIKSTLSHILKPIKNVKLVDLELSLEEIKQFLGEFKSHQFKVPDINVSTNIKINTHEYDDLDLKRKDALVLLAGFILKKCYDHHCNCPAMDNYIVVNDTSSICKSILNEIQKGICVVPQESFIEFVEMMEIRFRSFMSKDILETCNGKIVLGLLSAMQLVNFPMPCPCFPLLYAKKMFLRVRMYNMIKHNNTLNIYMSCENRITKLEVNDIN